MDNDISNLFQSLVLSAYNISHEQHEIQHSDQIAEILSTKCDKFNQIILILIDPCIHIHIHTFIHTCTHIHIK